MRGFIAIVLIAVLVLNSLVLWSPIMQLVSAVVNNAVGVFRQISTVGDPIYKHVSGGRWGMRQAIFKPNAFGSTCQFLGMASTYGALAIDAVTVYNAAMQDLKEGRIDNTVCSANKAFGGYFGAAQGAAVGASLLSFVPVIGPLAGGIVGGSIGMALGSSIGVYLAEVITAMPHC